MDRLRELFPGAEIDCLLVWQPENRRYLSGFTGTSGALVVTDRAAMLVTDFRYVEQAASQAHGIQVVKHEGRPLETLAGLFAQIGARRIGFEATHLTVSQYRELEERITGGNLVATTGLVEKLRLCKDDGELARIERAAASADRAFAHVLDIIRPGISEQKVALELEMFMKREGAEKPAFDFIVASGPRSSLPHGVAGERLLEEGDLVTLDFGCVLDGYCSDLTRTVVLGAPSPRQQEIYDLVLKAQQAGLAAVSPGEKASAVDEACRQVIRAAGYGDHFGHGTGHGVGLSVHEGPTVSARSDTVLEPGMVITVEPGVYLPGWGGVRLEDMVAITADGARILTRAPKVFRR